MYKSPFSSIIFPLYFHWSVIFHCYLWWPEGIHIIYQKIPNRSNPTQNHVKKHSRFLLVQAPKITTPTNRQTLRPKTSRQATELRDALPSAAELRRQQPCWNFPAGAWPGSLGELACHELLRGILGIRGIYGHMNVYVLWICMIYLYIYTNKY